MTAPGRLRKTPTGVLVFVFALALAIVALRHFSQPPAARYPRLAILPFQNLRQDPDIDFLGYSLADAIIIKLGTLSGLSVRPSATIQKYGNQMIDVAAVAKELNVDALLTGNFIREGDSLRITYQLVDGKTEKIIDRGSIDVKYDRLLEVQDRVSHEMITTLAVNLSSPEAERLRAGGAVNPAAYEYYLRGLDLYGKHDFVLAIKMLERSVELDVNYPLAWAYLGASYTSDAAFELGGREQYRKAQAAYEHALRIDPALIEAQTFFANLLIDNGKVEQAVPLLRDAAHMNPKRADVHWELGYAYRFAGMLQESVTECERARQLDPSLIGNGAALNTYLYLGQYEKFLRSLPENDSVAFLVFYRGYGEYYLQQWQRAASDFDRAYQLNPSLYTQVGKALSASVAQRPSEGLALLNALEHKIAERGVGDPEAAYKVAQAYSALGDQPAALRMLHMSVETGFFAYPYFQTDPLLDHLRHQPEFGELMEKARQRHEAFRRTFF
jgi:TolB-like protein